MSSINRFMCIKKKKTVMSAPHRFNTTCRAEEAGKVVFQPVIYLPKWYVEQMSDGVKSLGWILQLLSSLWCFSEAALLCLFSCLFESQLNNSPPPKEKKSCMTQQLTATFCFPNHPDTHSLSATILPLLFISDVARVSIKIFLRRLKVSRFSPIPSLFIQSSFALFHAEKLALRKRNGVGISKYKPVDYGRLQAIIDAKRQETDALGQKVN